MKENDFRQKTLIFLAGFMGSGKSTIGPILANTLGFEFIDVDAMIELRVGKTITQIFREFGEDGFRSMEREVLEEIVMGEQKVISLGGGTLASEKNFQLVHSHGFIVYLHLSRGEAIRRLKHKSDRPLLKDDEGERLGEDQLRQRISTVLEQREGFYNRADIVVSTDNKKVGKTVDEIVLQLRRVARI